MDFKDTLNKYIDMLGCSARELSEASGISPAVISRYRSSARKPASESPQIKGLAGGIAALAKSKGIDMNQSEISEQLEASLQDSTFNYETMRDNLNTLISSVDINISELARFLNYDVSSLSRIRSGQRKPSDPEGFISGVCLFLARSCNTTKDRQIVTSALGLDTTAAQSDAQFSDALRLWLCSEDASSGGSNVDSFLKKLDEFNLDDYIRAINFDSLKVPSMPLKLPVSRNYYGIVEMRKGELDFFKSTVLARGGERVFMCSDMPMEDMSEDMNFSKKWMFGLALMLKKGLHLDIIHNLDRPFIELMLGLESWIPMYMTGQISPYYLKGLQNSVYCHLDYVSDTAALSGECISGYHSDGSYYLTNNRSEVAYYRKRADMLLKKAYPLMDIYRKENETAFRLFIEKEVNASSNLRSIFSSLPVYTISKNLLEEILKSNDIADKDAKKIYDYRSKKLTDVENILKSGTIKTELPVLTQEEFEKYPIGLSLSEMFYEKDVYCTYEQYKRHIEETENFAEIHENLNLVLSEAHAFRNIQIVINEGKWVLISKNRHPAIHFVIRHSKLRKAIENMVIPVSENKASEG